MKIDDVEFGALVVGARDTLVVALPATTDADVLKDFADTVHERLGHGRVLIVAGAEAVVALRDTVGPCMDRPPRLGDAFALSCTLTAGHSGGHTDGSATWIKRDGRAALAEVNGT